MARAEHVAGAGGVERGDPQGGNRDLLAGEGVDGQVAPARW